MLSRYFPFAGKADTSHAVRPERHELRDRLNPTLVGEGGQPPGSKYKVYHALDMFGTLPAEYQMMLDQGAKWIGVEEGYLSGIVERYERRLIRWWQLEKRSGEKK